MTGPTLEDLATVTAVGLAARGAEYRIAGEADLEDAIAGLLESRGLPVERQVRLSPQDRIDLMVGAVGIELKVKGSAEAVTRQLARYAEHERVRALVLISSSRVHLSVPLRVGGVPVTVIILRGRL